MFNKVMKLIFYTSNLVLFLVSKFIPKNRRIWVFGAWFGEKYSDNSKFLYEYINKYRPEIRAIWLSKNPSIVERLNSTGFEAYVSYSFKAIIYSLRAQFSIFTQTNAADNMSFLNNGRTKIIQLWHGTPLKKIGYDDKLFSYRKKPSRLKYALFPFANEKYDLIIASSNEDKKNFITSFNSNNVVITGYPRNDFLFNDESTSGNLKIIYLPTFRDEQGSCVDLFSEYSFDLNKWVSMLSDIGAELYIKMHPVNMPSKNIIEKFSNCEKIIFMDDIDIVDILPKMNILITDYSSIYFDYLLTEKPIIFAPFDHEQYLAKDRELYYGYDEVTPGPKCSDWNDVLSWVEKFSEDSTLFLNERRKIKNKFHKYQDKESCKRVFNEISKLIK